MTIYTFGDPDLLREALLALATIFGLVEWSNPANAMGLGANMLAAALIGLLAVAIAGVTKQEIRIDFLLMALIIFGIAFSAKVDVNVEDIQTGDSRVVADVPIGVAMVGAAASSAAVSLTETIGTAIQRPGVTTSSLEVDGFMNPLQTLYILRHLQFGELDEYVYKSLLEFYRNCIGNTLDTNPNVFNLEAFKRSDNALEFMLTPGNFLNFTTVYYTELNPVGIAQSCVDTAGALDTDVSNLILSSDNLLAKLRMLRGAKYYNQAFDLAEIDSAADIISRGTMNGQSFMAAALMRNFINDAEAWRMADYGSNSAQYVADITGSLEEKRLSDTTIGAVALEYMFPLMTFVQFLFFTLAPFIALIVIASPFTAGKTLGMYMLLGVWAYSWLPIAAIINHYMQISVGNAIEFSDITAVGVEYSALVAIDSFYDQIANKLSIGSAALAATPIIVGALLTASMSGFQSLAGKVMGNTPVNTSMGAPKLGQGRPLVTAGGMGSLPEGMIRSDGGMAKVASLSQAMGYGTANTGLALQTGFQRANEISTKAEADWSTQGSVMKKAMDQFTQSGIVTNQSKASYNAQIEQAVQKTFGSKEMYSDLMSLNASQRSEAETFLGVNLGILGAKDKASMGSGNQAALNRILAMDKSETANLGARFSEAFSETTMGQTSVGGALAQAYETTSRAKVEYEQEMSEAERLSQSAMSVSSMTQGGSEPIVGLLQNAFSARAPADVIEGLRGLVTAQGPEVATAIFEDAEKIHWNEGKPIRGADGLPDRNMNEIDQGGTLLLAVGNAAASDGRLFPLLASMYRELGRVAGTAAVHDASGLTNLRDELAAGNGVRDDVERRQGTFGNPNEQIREADKVAAPTNGERDRIQGISGEARRQGDQPAQVSSPGQARMEGRNEVNQARVESGTVPGDIGGQFEETSQLIDTALDPQYRATPSITQGLLEIWGGQAGFETAFENFLEPTLNGSLTPYQALGGLTNEVISMNRTGSATYRAERVYDNFMNKHGFSSEEALVATYASLGLAAPGARDYLDNMLMGLAGANAAGKAGMPGLAKGGAYGAVAAGLYAAYAEYETYQSNKEFSLDYLKETYTQRFAQQNVDQSLVTAFSNDIDRAQDTQDLVEIMMAYRGNDGEPLSQEQMMAIISPGARRSPSIDSKDIPLMGVRGDGVS